MDPHGHLTMSRASDPEHRSSSRCTTILVHHIPASSSASAREIDVACASIDPRRAPRSRCRPQIGRRSALLAKALTGRRGRLTTSLSASTRRRRSDCSRSNALTAAHKVIVPRALRVSSMRGLIQLQKHASDDPARTSIRMCRSRASCPRLRDNADGAVTPIRRSRFLEENFGEPACSRRES